MGYIPDRKIAEIPSWGCMSVFEKAIHSGGERPRSEVANKLSERLVRDRIPDIIEATGNVPIWRELDTEAYDEALLAEMRRAVSRFAETESLESLSDMLEALEEWLLLKGLSEDDVSRAKEERRKRCGGYGKRRYLEHVASSDDVIEHPLFPRHC